MVKAMVNIDWFGRYEHAPDGKIVQSWDTAIRAGGNNDFTVCTSWCMASKGYYLLDVFAKKMDQLDTKHHIGHLASVWRPDAILLESKAGGDLLVQELVHNTRLPILSIQPASDKISRFAAVTALIEAGRVWLPKNASWLVDYEAEILGFPNAPHDDAVDSTSQFLNWVRGRRQI
jgi:predicted phage terminase large subunit-like protein